MGDDGDQPSRRFALADYFAAFERHYPDKGVPARTLRDWATKPHAGDDAPDDRYVPLDKRPFVMRQNVHQARGGDERWLGASRSYKGLVNLKSPFDLVLYANLLWELQPRTIIELGALQGGSALWFADQLEAIVGTTDATVHSFELYDQAIHPRAAHPRLTFHQANLRKLSTLPADVIDAWPHPWLVVEDAHVNTDGVTRFFASRMQHGDYLVWEDLLLGLWTTHDLQAKALALAAECGLVVDTKYTDAFGTNVTTAPNGWLVKRA